MPPNLSDYALAFRPVDAVAVNLQPLPPRVTWVLLNPQPLPPRSRALLLVGR
jgi:hypothetical protein